jgi:hypothetical protein
MKKPLALLLLFALSLFSACSKRQANGQLQLSVGQNANNAAAQQIQYSPNGDEIINNAPRSVAVKPGEKKSGWYNTEVYELYDGYGNKTETRVFKDHSRLTSVMVATTAKGEQTVEVYGQNGERVQLSANMADKVLSGTGDEVADAAGIFQTKKQVQTPEFKLNLSQAQNLQADNVNSETVSTGSAELPTKEPDKIETPEQVQTTQKTEVLQSSVKTESKSPPNDER